MELWIRTQDKMTLSKINNIKLVEYNGEYSLVGYCERELDDFNLSIYSTKERALEVLDEIQNILIDYSKMSRVVYEMPKE